MKKFIILLFLGLFSVSINAQQTQENLDFYKHAKRKLGAGTTLMVVGGVVMIAGGIALVSGLNAEESNSSRYPYESSGNDGFILGAALVTLAGEILFIIGIPNLVVGIVQKSVAKRRLQISMVNFRTPNSYGSTNGIGLKIRF
jgi:hypothetical protein